MTVQQLATEISETRCGVYCRISRDEIGDMLGVRRQEKDCRGLADKKEWPVVGVYIDDDISAYTGKTRPAYQQMLADLASGKINAVICYDLDRLHRLPKELEHFFEVCDEAKVTQLATVSGDINLATNDGKFTARIMGAVAKKSSDDASRRIKRRMLDDAAAGKPHGPRAFGYNPDRLTVNKAEAKIVKEMVKRVLAGEALNSIARDFNERGLQGAQGGKHGWTGTHIRNILVNPRLAGLRAHHGVIVAKGQWPAIIDRATHERLVAHFSEPSRTRTSPNRLKLLSKFCFCGLCGAPLHYTSRINMSCAKSPGRPGCGKVSIASAPLERIITEAVIKTVDGASKELAGLAEEMDDTGAVKEVQALEARMVELGEMFAAGDISRGEWMVVRRSLEGKLIQARKTIAAANRTRHGIVPIEGALRDAWPKMTVAEQRAVLEIVVDKIVINRAGKRGPGVDFGRVDVKWRV